MNTQVDIVELRRLHEAAMEEVRRLTQANADLRKDRDRAVEEAKRQHTLAKGAREQADNFAAHCETAVQKADALSDDRDALAAHVERLVAALNRAYEGAARQLAEPRHHGSDQYALTDMATTCELALAATPAMSLAAHDAALLREVADKIDSPYTHDGAAAIRREAYRIEKEAPRG